MIRKKLSEPFILSLTLVGCLLLFYIIPEFSIGSWNFKKIDLLADLKEFEVEKAFQAARDSVIVEQDSIHHLVEDRCRPGITCIEDYSGDSTAMRLFFSALADTKKSGKRIRIAFYGDSFIEGDVFCGSFRDTLQSLFGGRGVGFVPITSNVAGFRNTIKHRFDNWKTVSAVNPRDSSVELGPSGHCFLPLGNNWVEYQASKQRFLTEFNTIRFFYTNYDEATVQYTIDDDTLMNMDDLPKSKALQEWVHSGKKIKNVKLEFYPHDQLQLYGTAFEQKEGIYVDNFSLRGNSGLSLTGLNDKLLKDFGKLRDYKLIILQFGLNMVREDSLNYKAYTRRMIGIVAKLKKAYPKASFLLLSVSDRTSNKSGRLQTMNAIPAMRNAQRTIAAKSKIAFWDMYEAMGGENSMIRFAQSRPPLAAKDYTHLTFQGGKKLAGSLAKSLIFEAEKYDRRQSKKKRK